MKASLVGPLVAAMVVLVAPLVSTSAVAADDGATSPSKGKELAFDRSKGNCLSCHVIKGGDLPGTIGPELTNLKSRYANKDDVAAIIFDETTKNPLTVMPPFGRNLILTKTEIGEIVDFLYGQ